MVLPLIPIVIGVGLTGIGAGTYFGLKNQDPDITNEYQTTFQDQYLTEQIFYDFENSTFEEGSTLDIFSRQSQSAEQISTPQNFDTEQGDNTLLYVFLGVVAIGGYLYFRK